LGGVTPEEEVALVEGGKRSQGVLLPEQHALLEAEPDLAHVRHVGERVARERQETRLVSVGERGDPAPGEDRARRV
jgi:hypothetical protein